MNQLLSEVIRLDGMRRRALFKRPLVLFGLLIFMCIEVSAFPVSVAHLKATLEAEKLEKSEQWEAAAWAYEEAFKVDPSNVHAFRKTAEMWLAAGDTKKAILTFEELSDNKAYTAMALRALAGIYGRAGNAAKATQYLEQYQQTTRRGLLKTLLSDPDFETVRQDKGFQTLIAKENDYAFPRSEQHPTWSPDGKRIAFSYLKEGTSSWDIYTVDPTGENLRRLTQTTQNEIMLRWSPDGKEIAFTRTGRDYLSPHGIFTVSPDGAQVRPVVTVASQIEKLPRGFETPTWCLDGSCIVFLGTVGGVSQVFKIGRDGKNLVQLTNTPEAGKGTPSVSPNGEKVCFDVNKDGEFAYQELYEIECVPMNGSMARETLLTGMYWWFPVWSPDGSVFTASLWDSVEDRFGRVAIVDPKTKEYEYITPREWDSWWQAISPDNAKVVFGASEDPFSGFKRLYIMNLDRSELRLLVP